jgi:bacterioferritin-associated ferredoxin
VATPSNSERPVFRCVCHDVRFAELVRLHRETGAGFGQLQEWTRCGTGCGLCIPYIKIALRTGESRLAVLSDAQLKQRGGMDP